MKFRSSFPLLAWSVRDVFRYPLETMLLFLSLVALVAIPGTAMLLSQALSDTAGMLLKNSPAVVIRKVSPTGWAALPAEESIRLAKSVPGVVRAGIRIWGTANSPAGPVTVFGIDDSNKTGSPVESLPLPGRGEAVLGAGVLPGEDPESLNLTAQDTLNLKVIGILESNTSMVAYDMVLTHPDDARKILGISMGYASDLFVNVFHETEADAILPDLARAFPWPVRLTTRNEATGIYVSASARRSGIVYVTIIPALLALALVVVGVVKSQIGRSCNVGLFKAFGWTTTDIFQFQLLKALFIGIPAVTAGMICSYWFVFRPGVSWPGYLFFGWKHNPPPLYLNASGVFLVLIQIAALIFLPYLAATLWPALRAAVSDPQDFLER